MYKIAITLEVETREQRNQLLKDIRSLLVQQTAAVKGKVRQTHEQEVYGGMYLPLFGFGVEESAATPVEKAIDEKPVTEDEDPRTPFDRFLGREDEDE